MHTNATMVSDQITRMKKLDYSHRSVYETALKHASATAFIGKDVAVVIERISNLKPPSGCAQVLWQRFVLDS